MIRDAVVLADIRADWAGVEAIRAKLQRSAFAAKGLIGGSYPFTLADAAHNLPFVHAFAVLNDLLEQLAKESVFTCNRRELGTLLKASEKHLPWQDFALISTGKDRRNDVAHRGELLERGECWQYIDAIKRELVAWGVIDPA